MRSDTPVFFRQFQRSPDDTPTRMAVIRPMKEHDIERIPL
jgi:hypothetical protein